jgi:branched-chain amino acid transport system permease protein
MEITSYDIFIQQLLVGLSNGAIIGLIALGYTMVYGIIELVNFAHGDVFMLGSFFALTLLGLFFPHLDGYMPPDWGQFLLIVGLLLIVVPLFSGTINWCIDRLAYQPLRGAPRLAPLVSAIGVSFILINIGLFWGDLPVAYVNKGGAATPKDFPAIFNNINLLGEESAIFVTWKEIFVWVITVPVMLTLTFIIKYTTIGKAMRAVAQNQTAATLMGINVDRVIGQTFIIGGVLAGLASVVYSVYNNTVFFQMGFRAGMDAFAAAVIGGIGNLPGAFLGGLFIGIVRGISDGYIATSWTNVIVFSLMIVVLVFRPAGILGLNYKEKV